MRPVFAWRASLAARERQAARPVGGALPSYASTRRHDAVGLPGRLPGK